MGKVHWKLSIRAVPLIRGLGSGGWGRERKEDGRGERKEEEEGVLWN